MSGSCLRRLGILSGAFTLESAVAIAADGVLDEAAAGRCSRQIL